MTHIIYELQEKAKHGTGAIFFEDADQLKEEAKRLSQFNRGFLIEKQSLKDLIREVPGFADMDGVALCDMDGQVYCVGAILDGIVEEQGDAGRGARYNSIRTYVKTKSNNGENKKLIVGVSISEDPQNCSVFFSEGE